MSCRSSRSTPPPQCGTQRGGYETQPVGIGITMKTCARKHTRRGKYRVNIDINFQQCLAAEFRSCLTSTVAFPCAIVALPRYGRMSGFSGLGVAEPLRVLVMHSRIFFFCWKWTMLNDLKKYLEGKTVFFYYNFFLSFLENFMWCTKLFLHASSSAYWSSACISRKEIPKRLLVGFHVQNPWRNHRRNSWMNLGFLQK